VEWDVLDIYSDKFRNNDRQTLLCLSILKVKKLTHSNNPEICMFCVQLYRKDEREFFGTIYHKVSRRLETAVQMEWMAGSNDTKFAIAAKYCPDIDTTFRVLCC